MRFTISRWMAVTAVLGLNIGLVRAYLLAENGGEHMDLYDFGFLIAFALQLGLWRYLRAEGRHRRFWLGFQVSGLAATLALSIVLGSDIDLNKAGTRSLKIWGVEGSLFSLANRPR